MKVNIMDQLEAHFMLAEFDGQDATGSLRAQVVDEISGLSGIEGLIREVSLDNLRLTRETNQTEERIKEVAAQLHDGQTLNHEEALLKRVGEAIQKYDENLEVLMALKGIDTDYRNAKGEVSRLKDELNNLPNATKALTKLATGETALAKTTATSTAYAEWSIINKLCATMKIEADSLPDDLKVTEKAQQALEALQKAIQVATLAKNTLVESEITMKLHNELAKTSDPEAVKSRLLVAEKSLDKALQISEFLFQWGSLDGEIKRLDNERVAVRVGEELAAQEYNEALAKVDVCPVTLKPISGECLKEGRLVISIKENR
jgi:tetratricopeptide (TPR) repeat protein